MKSRKEKITLCLLIVVGAIFLMGNFSAQTQESKESPDLKNYKFINGKWFDGEKFEEKVFYSVNGFFSETKPKKIDKTVDLKNSFVIPPFGDSHTHFFENVGYEASQSDKYLKQGIFYARSLNNRLSNRQKVANFFGSDKTVDVAYANGGITAPGAHPIPPYEAQALGISLWDKDEKRQKLIRESRIREGDAYFVVAKASDLEKIWSNVVKGKPDILKLYLNRSEDFETDKIAGRTPRGLDPKIFPSIVKRAKAEGLRTVAHVETVNDFRIAVESGVNELAHMTGYSVNARNPFDNAKKNIVSDELLREAAKRGVVVTPTFYRGLAMIKFIPKEYKPNDATVEQVRIFHRKQIQRLQAAGVPIAIGADLNTLTALDEVMYYHEIGALDSKELLKAWTQTTPRAIFPKRKIGFLNEGFEASFLVLKENPLLNFQAVKNIEMRFKKGQFIEFREE